MKELKTKLYLLDMDGTIYVGEQLVTGAKEKLAEIKQKGGSYCFVTNNSSRSRQEYVNKLARLGIKATQEEIFTSGDATAIYLNKYHGGKSVYVLGRDTLKCTLAEYGIKVTENTPDLVVVGYDTELTYAKLCATTDLIHSGVPYLCTHADINCPAAPYYLPDVGSFIALIEKSTGVSPFVICGKPYAPMGEAIKQKFNLSSNAIAFVGDRLYTDMRFALSQGFGSVLTLSGETTLTDYQQSDMKVDDIITSIAQLKVE